jgi:hypothetical protein
MSHIQAHRSLGVVSALLFAVLAGACASSTSVEAKWTPPPAQASVPLTKIVTVFISNSESIRRAGEDRLARELLESGTAATPAYQVIGPDDRAAVDGVLKQSGSPQSDAIKDRLRTMGYDGIVTMQIVDKEQELVYSPSYYGSYGGYWGYGYCYPYGGGWGGSSVYTQSTYRTETTAYSLRTGRVVWAGRLKTVDPKNAKHLLGSTAKRVTHELEKERNKAG